ncbi:MAG: TetR/AcrR family transcriptional regulator [Bacillota bacterium]
MTEKPKRQLILEAAFEVFSAKGFHAAKVEEIAEKAGVGKGTIYEYFKSKSDVFQEMYKWYVEEYFTDLESGLQDAERPVERLYNIVKNHIIFLSRFKNLAGKLLSESSSHIDLGNDFKNLMIKTYKEKMSKVKFIIEEGIRKGYFRSDLDTDLCTMYFFSSLGGISHSMFLFNVEMSPDEVAGKVIDLLLNGIRK